MLPDTNKRITATAWAAATGRLNGIPTSPGRCLQFVRVVVEAALELPSHDAYRRWLVAGTTRRPGDDAVRLAAAKLDPWAADIERSVKQLGWPVPASQRFPGDLVFNFEAAAPYGHVGVLLDYHTVLENIAPGNRPTSIHLPNSLSLTPFASRSWTLVARVRNE